MIHDISLFLNPKSPVFVMRNRIETIIEELERLRKDGVKSVYVERSTLEKLKGVLPSEQGQFSGNPRGNVSAAPGKRTTALSSRGSRSRKQIMPIPPPPIVTLPEGTKREQWEWLRREVLESKICREHLNPGKKIVFGVGSIDADIFFCGEAPGADEEIQGEPFIGRAGQLLTRIIQAMNLERVQVYIGNIMNWRPEIPTLFGNRPPTQEEMNFCLPYLKAQLKIVQPKVIVALGATAANGLLGPDPQRKMGSVHGHWFRFDSTPLLITYHPAYVLRNGTNHVKRLIWEDMLKVMERVGLPISQRQREYFSGSSESLVG